MPDLHSTTAERETDLAVDLPWTSCFSRLHARGAIPRRDGFICFRDAIAQHVNEVLDQICGNAAHATQASGPTKFVGSDKHACHGALARL